VRICGLSCSCKGKGGGGGGGGIWLLGGRPFVLGWMVLTENIVENCSQG